MIYLILNDVGISTAISAVLALVLVIAQRYLNNYGECKIMINSMRELTVKGGNSLLASLNDQEIFLASACGGRGTCGACKCKILEGGGPLLPTEKPLLTPEEQKNNFRLACQVKVRADLGINIPEDIFNIRKYTATVEKIIDLNYDTKALNLRLKEPSDIIFKAGQYVQLETKPYAKIKQKTERAYSISSKPEDKGILQLIIRLVPEGICTTWVHSTLKEGDEVNLTGPFGDFYIRETQADMMFVAGGSGVAPIKAMLEHLQVIGTNRKMTYFYGARSIRDLYLTEEMKAFEQIFPDFKYVPILSQVAPEDKWEGRTGYIMPFIKEFIRDPNNTEGYMCGSPGMLNACLKELVTLGVSQDKIYYDSFV